MSERPIATTDGSERVINGAVIDKFATDLRGELLCVDDQGYDAARKVWNGMIDKCPALIARCTGTPTSFPPCGLRANTTFSCRSAVVGITMPASPSASAA
jgi:hypothetical protein